MDTEHWSDAGHPTERLPQPIPAKDVAGLVATAGRAPSVQNTQPWRFVHHRGMLELWADTSRRLAYQDPNDRELTISCGSALATLRLAIRGHGHLAAVRILPLAKRPKLLATVGLGPERSPSAYEKHLLAAVVRRHTHREPFEPRPVDTALLAQLQHRAESWGARLHYIDGREDRTALAEIVATADRLEHENLRRQQEFTRWIRPWGSRRRDGVPATAYPSQPTPPAPGTLPIRDFTGTGARGAVPPAYRDHPVMAVLTTKGDEPVDWIVAGQALQHVLLHAATQWLFASLHTQALELPQTRGAISEVLRLDGQPQMMLQLGYATAARTTPRRPVSETLVD